MCWRSFALEFHKVEIGGTVAFRWELANLLAEGSDTVIGGGMGG